jgi:hypothetical protein
MVFNLDQSPSKNDLSIEHDMLALPNKCLHGISPSQSFRSQVAKQPTIHWDRSPDRDRLSIFHNHPPRSTTIAATRVVTVLHSDLHYYYTIPLDETSIRETLI